MPVAAARRLPSSHQEAKNSRSKDDRLADLVPSSTLVGGGAGGGGGRSRMREDAEHYGAIRRPDRVVDGVMTSDGYEYEDDSQSQTDNSDDSHRGFITLFSQS